MKRCVALLLSALMLLTAIPAVGANSYNDDQFDWGEYACPHTQTETVEAVTSTCITPGHATYTYCVVCKLLLDGCRDDLPLGDHTYAVETTPADCLNAGRHVYTCSVCDDSYEETIPAIGHAYDAVVTAPDCVSGGYTTHTCANCGDTYTDSATAALGHNYVPLSAEPATCEQDGFEKFYCTHCNDSYTVTIPATGHKYEIVITAPTCESGGYTTHTCTACGDVVVDNRTSALGHTYDDDRDTDCNTCGAVREVETVLVGDVKVNNKDLGRLQQYINGWEVEVDLTACDVTGDGKVNNKDLGRLQQYINGWDVQLG